MQTAGLGLQGEAGLAHTHAHGPRSGLTITSHGEGDRRAHPSTVTEEVEEEGVLLYPGRWVLLNVLMARNGIWLDGQLRK